MPGQSGGDLSLVSALKQRDGQESAAFQCMQLLRVEAIHSLDESPLWGATLTAMIWIVPSTKNTWDWNYETDMYPGVDVRT